MTVTRNTIRVSPIVSKTIPERAILVMGTLPDPYTTAFYGVEIGSMNPKEHAKSAQRAGTSGSRQSALATGITMGTTMVALAVLEVVSESRTAHRS